MPSDEDVERSGPETKTHENQPAIAESSETPRRNRRGQTLTPVKLLLILFVFYLLVQVQIIVLLIVLAILFATIIEHPLRHLEHRGLPRAAGILTIYAVILSSLVVALLVFVPLISQEARIFGNQAPMLVDQLAENWRESDNPLLSGSGYRLLTRISFQIENPSPPPGGAAIDIAGRVGAVGLGIVSMFIIGFYWLMEKPLIRRLLIDQFEESTGERIARIWENVEAKVGGWLRGQLLLCLIIGIIAGVGYYFMDVRFWLLLAVLAGIMELIPIVGPWVGGIPAVMVALLDSWEKAIIVAIFLMMLQLAENAILVPRIMKGTIGLSPLTVFVAILAGGAYMGVLGALLAIPIAAGIQVVVVDFIRQRQHEMHLRLAASEQSINWRGVFGQFLDPEPRSPRRIRRHESEGGDSYAQSGDEPVSGTNSPGSQSHQRPSDHDPSE